jgi:alternate signal-mediated exported protein
MKNTTKGALAATAATALLLGGAGSLAYWSDSVTIGGGTITAGHISLDDTTGAGDDCSTASWTLDNGEVVAGAVFTPGPASDAGESRLVPGDVITKVCTFNVNALGEHLRATLGTTGGASTGDLTAEVTTSAVFTIGGATVTTITEANNNAELKATITLTFNGPAATNASQDDELDLSDYTVSLTQVHS